jgi:hypothetical protein
MYTIILNSRNRVDTTTTGNHAQFYIEWCSILKEGKYRVKYSICKQLVGPVVASFNTINPLGLELYYPFTSSTLNLDGVSVGNLATGTLVYDSSLTGVSTITGNRLSTIHTATPPSGQHGLVINRSVSSGTVATISLWFNCSSLPRLDYWLITTFQDNAGNRFLITIRPDNKILIASSGLPFDWVSTFSIVVNTTYHMVAVMNNGTNSLYINGVFNSTGPASVPSNTAGFNSIMRDPLGNGLIGTVDDYRYYNRALTLPEITTLYSVQPN